MKQIKVILNFQFSLLILLAFSSCKKGKSEEQNKQIEQQYFTFQIGEAKIKAELAILPEERQRGLMFRKKMEPGTGMLFIFEYGTPQKFWMKNTKIPLDIGYFSPQGKLMEIHAAKPFDLNGVPSRSKNIQFVLELNLHDFRNQKINIGDRLDLSEIRNAIKLRGLNPQKYQLQP
jgi:uncharacterized membrane protein (UPF0127 family)